MKLSREQSFNIIRTAVSMLVAVLVAFVIILLVSDQPVESIRIFLVAPFIWEISLRLRSL